MSFDYQAGDDFSTGSFLRDPGRYHMIVTEMRHPATKKNGEPILDAQFCCSVSVVAGPNPQNVGKNLDLIFWRPKVGGRDEGKFARKKTDRLFLALGLMKKDDAGRALKIELEDAVGRQFMVELEPNREENRPPQIAFAEIYHVDDGEVADWPKDPKFLAMIPPELRHVRTEATKNTPPAPPAGNEFTDQFVL